jgi:hypothetical protein
MRIQHFSLTRGSGSGIVRSLRIRIEGIMTKNLKGAGAGAGAAVRNFGLRGKILFGTSALAPQHL